MRANLQFSPFDHPAFTPPSPNSQSLDNGRPVGWYKGSSGRTRYPLFAANEQQQQFYVWCCVAFSHIEENEVTRPLGPCFFLVNPMGLTGLKGFLPRIRLAGWLLPWPVKASAKDATSHFLPQHFQAKHATNVGLKRGERTVIRWLLSGEHDGTSTVHHYTMRYLGFPLHFQTSDMDPYGGVSLGIGI